VSQDPQFGSTFGGPAGPPQPEVTAEPPPRPLARAWWRRREVLVGAAATRVILGAVAFVVLGSGEPSAAAGGVAVRPAATSGATSGTGTLTTTPRSGARNPFVGTGSVAGAGGGTGTGAAASTTPVTATTVTTTVAGAAVTTTKTRTTTVTTTSTVTTTAHPVYLFLRDLAGVGGVADFTVNTTEVDNVAVGAVFEDDFTYTGTTSATCLDVTYNGSPVSLCVGEVAKVA
jgi:hypothetical protein